MDNYSGRSLSTRKRSKIDSDQRYFSNVNEYGNENDCYLFTKTKIMLIYQTKII